MHYRNGRPAQNGDRIIQFGMSDGKAIAVGTLTDSAPVLVSIDNPPPQPSDIELQLLTDEYQREVAAGRQPNYDWTALSDDELSAIVDGDMTPLETCPLLPSSNQPARNV